MEQRYPLPESGAEVWAEMNKLMRSEALLPVEMEGGDKVGLRMLFFVNRRVGGGKN